MSVAEGAFEIPGGGERTLWFLLTTRNPVDIEAVTLARENAAIDAEDIHPSRRSQRRGSRRLNETTDRSHGYESTLNEQEQQRRKGNPWTQPT